jgi:hypothetical protein
MENESLPNTMERDCRQRNRAVLIGSLCASLCLWVGCQINEIERPENPCTEPLRRKGLERPVSFANPVEGQLSLYRGFRLAEDSLGFTRDTLLAMVGVPYPDAFTYVEQECPENYLAPDLPMPSSHVLQWVEGNLRPSGFTELLPFDAYKGLDLHPQGPILDFRGLKPPEGLADSSYGRILGFTVGKKVYDTVSVRVENEGMLRYWIYSAQTGPLAAGQVDAYGHITGWIRAAAE